MIAKFTFNYNGGFEKKENAVFQQGSIGVDSYQVFAPFLTTTQVYIKTKRNGDLEFSLWKQLDYNSTIGGWLKTATQDELLVDGEMKVVFKFNNLVSQETSLWVRKGTLIVPEMTTYEALRDYVENQEQRIDHIIDGTTDIAFDNTGTDLDAEFVDDAIKEVNNKANANEQNIADMKDGTTIVKKAEQDKNGNTIDLTYATKTENNQKADKTYVDNQDLSLQQQITTLGTNKVDKTQKIIGLDLQDDILIGEFRTAIGNATQTHAGLLSAEDKTHLDNLVALLASDDGDTVVDTIGEILAIFQNYPEGADFVTALASKVDKVAGKGLSQNDFTDALKNKLDGLLNGSQYYDKNYIDALKDHNGWESELLGTLSNNGTIALSIINQYDEIQMYAKDTLDVIDNENIRPSLMQSGDSVYFFDDTQAFIMVDTVFGFYAPAGYTLQVVGVKYTELKASDTTYDNATSGMTATTVQGAIDEVEARVESVETNKEDKANKATDFAVVNDTKYPTTKAIVNLFGLTKVVENPSGFTWVDHPLKNKIFTNSKGLFYTDYDVRINEIDGLDGYLSPLGSDSNNGLTPETPKLTLNSLIANTSIARVNYAQGLYPRQTLANYSRDIELIGSDIGKTIFCASDNLTWSLTSGKTYTYQANRTNTLNVVDFRYEDDDDVYRKYILVSSIDDVESTAGTWFTNAGIVYVHTLTDDIPTNQTVRALIDANAFIITTATPKNIFIKDILSVGGTQTASSIYVGDSENNVYMYNVRMCYVGKVGSLAGNGLSLINAQAIIQNCKAFKNSGDGFNYHITGGLTSHIIEINCIAYENGDNAGNDNGSTIHDGGKIIRLNGMYYENRGPNIADVNSGTESWNIGCVAYKSTCPSNENIGSVDYGFNAGNVKVWLDGCISYSSDKSAIFGTATDEVVANIRNCNFEVTPEVAVSSTLIKY